jgi:hypothetical protein
MTKTKMVHKTPHDASNKSLEAYRSTGVPTDFAALVTKAEAGWSAFKAAETVRFFQAAAQVHEVLALIYAVHEVGKDAPHEYAEFLKARQVEPSPRAHNDYYATVQAFVDVKERSTLRQRVSQYAQVLVIMAERKIAPGSAASWLAKAETVSGKKLSGIAKALSLYRSLPSVKARNSAATVEADEKAKRSVAAFIETSRRRRLPHCPVRKRSSPSRIAP